MRKGERQNAPGAATDLGRVKCGRLQIPFSVGERRSATCLQRHHTSSQRARRSSYISCELALHRRVGPSEPRCERPKRHQARSRARRLKLKWSDPPGPGRSRLIRAESGELKVRFLAGRRRPLLNRSRSVRFTSAWAPSLRMTAALDRVRAQLTWHFYCIPFERSGFALTYAWAIKLIVAFGLWRFK